jgi:hypothetical protein
MCCIPPDSIEEPKNSKSSKGQKPQVAHEHFNAAYASAAQHMSTSKTHTHVHTYAHTCIWVQAQHTHTHTRTHKHTHMHTYAHTRIWVQATHTRTCTHIHTPAWPQAAACKLAPLQHPAGARHRKGAASTQPRRPAASGGWQPGAHGHASPCCEGRRAHHSAGCREAASKLAGPAQSQRQRTFWSVCVFMCICVFCLICRTKPHPKRVLACVQHLVGCRT